MDANQVSKLFFLFLKKQSRLIERQTETTSLELKTFIYTNQLFDSFLQNAEDTKPTFENKKTIYLTEWQFCGANCSGRRPKEYVRGFCTYQERQKWMNQYCDDTIPTSDSNKNATGIYSTFIQLYISQVNNDT